MSNDGQPMTVLSKRLLDLSEQCNTEIENVFNEYKNPDSLFMYNNTELAIEKLKEIQRRYKDREWDIIDEETSKPVVNYMTVSQILEKYEHCLDKDQIQILKNLE